MTFLSFGPPDRGSFALALLCFARRGTVIGSDEWESNVIGDGHGGLATAPAAPRASVRAYQADMAAALALASSGMTTPFACAIFLAYNICAGLTGLASSFPGVSLSAFLGACSPRNFRQIDIDVS